MSYEITWSSVIISMAIGAVFMGFGLWQFISPQVGMFRRHDVIDKELGDRSDAAELGERLIAYGLGLILVLVGGFFLWLGIATVQLGFS